MRILCGAALAVWMCLPGCSARKDSAETRQYSMGERVLVGQMIYTVSEAEWLGQLGDAAAPRMPQHKFLAIRLSVTNGGARTFAIPPTVLLDGSGQTYSELTNAEGLPDWLGYLRMLKPAQTEHGVVVFDVPPGSYRLKVLNDADQEDQSAALVNVPYETPGLPEPAGR
jgi:hypothetical protein